MENNIYSLGKSRGNSKYKLKSLIELIHKIPKNPGKEPLPGKLVAFFGLCGETTDQPRNAQRTSLKTNWETNFVNQTQITNFGEK